jgi:phosphate transport system substrate-binding protein
VARIVQQTPNSIGYVELVYASQSGLPAGKVQNAAGKFVTADQQSILAAADGAAKNTPADFRCSLTNAPGEASYPIASWIVIATTSAAPKQQAVKGLLRWMLTDGQTYLAPAGFAPVPQEVVDKELRALDNLP